MSRMTLRKLSELTRDTLDNARVGENMRDLRWFDEQLMVARNFFKDQEMSRLSAKGQTPDAAWFTTRKLAILRDTDGEYHYVQVPNGITDMTGDRGIRVRPVAGIGNPFVRFPQGMTSMRPDLSNAEGNLVWERWQPDRIVFTNMHTPYGNGYVMVDTVDSGTPDDPFAPINMPSDYERKCMDAVLNLCGFTRGEDKKADWTEGTTK